MPACTSRDSWHSNRGKEEAIVIFSRGQYSVCLATSKQMCIVLFLNQPLGLSRIRDLLTYMNCSEHVMGTVNPYISEREKDRLWDQV